LKQKINFNKAGNKMLVLEELLCLSSINCDS